MTATTKPPRHKVLVVIHHNEHGPWLEVFADDNVDVRIETAPSTSTPDGEGYAEEIVRHRLPKYYRNLLDTKPRAFDVVRKLKPSQLVDTDHYTRTLRALDALEKALSDDNGEEVILWSA